MFPIRDHNRSRRTPYVVIALIAVNVLVWLYDIGVVQPSGMLNRFYSDYAMVPYFISQGEGYQGLFTHMFLHGGVIHLAGNMLILWIYGDNMEDEMGHAGFALFYLLSGLGAALAQYAFEPASAVPMIGASGAVAGVMGGYLLLFPKARVDTLVIFFVYVRIFPIPAWILLGLWLVFQVVGGFSAASGAPGVAYFAHLGGFFVGLALTIPVWLGEGGPRFWRRTEGHPPHPDAEYERINRSRIPAVRRSGGRSGKRPW